jgi:HlyD family secretion protein
MRSYKTLMIVAVVAAAAAYWYYARSPDATSEVRYQTEPATIGRIESIVNTAGTISPVVTVDVGSEVSGLISELYADFNSEVKAGDVIARIDDRTIRARLKQNEADVAVAAANLEQQRANLNRARADLELANTEIKRQRQLVERQLASQADLDRTDANQKIAEAQLEVAMAQVAGAQATHQQRQAQLEQTQLDLDRTYIRSPVDGTVIDRQVDVGQTVAASLSAPLLFQIAQDLTQMQIEADVDEADIGQIKEGLNARFTVDAFPERTFEGSVSQVRKAATVTNNVVTYKVIIGARNPRQQLLPGMTANVDIVLGEKDDVLRVSNSALRFTPPGAENDAAGGFGGGLAGRIDEIAGSLNLTAEQRRAVEAAAGDMQKAIEELRSQRNAFGGFPGPGGPGGNQRERFQQLRQRMINQLNGVLSAEQLAGFEAALSSGFGAGGGPGGPPGAPGNGPSGSGGFQPDFANMRRGQVWMLENGAPKRVRVLVGLSDSQFSEVQSNELEEGDAVIVRVAR